MSQRPLHPRFDRVPAHHPGVLVVVTVVRPQPCVLAVQQTGLRAGALHIVQQYAQAPALAKFGVLGRLQGAAEAQLSAHHLGVPARPQVVAHRAPLAAGVDLHPAAVAQLVPLPRQPHRSVGRGRGHCRRHPVLGLLATALPLGGPGRTGGCGGGGGRGELWLSQVVDELLEPVHGGVQLSMALARELQASEGCRSGR